MSGLQGLPHPPQILLLLCFLLVGSDRVEHSKFVSSKSELFENVDCNAAPSAYTIHRDQHRSWKKKHINCSFLPHHFRQMVAQLARYRSSKGQLYFIFLGLCLLFCFLDEMKTNMDFRQTPFLLNSTKLQYPNTFIVSYLCLLIHQKCCISKSK